MSDNREIQKIIVYDSDGNELLNVNVESCRVAGRARLISHPVETGSPIFDNKVNEPTTISVRLIVDAADKKMASTLWGMKQDRRFSFCKVQTREAIYQNMCCVECAHDETAEMLDKMAYNIRFQEVMKAQKRAIYENPDDAPNEHLGRIAS